MVTQCSRKTAGMREKSSVRAFLTIPVACGLGEPIKGEVTGTGGLLLGWDLGSGPEGTWKFTL